jgi:hypothetical protein
MRPAQLAAWLALVLLGIGLQAAAEDDTRDAAEEAEAVAAAAAAADETAGTTPDNPKTMSGMSILGNEEAPKALVIVPWKSSELGDDPSLADSLDERARPVDPEVFARELRYYGIRAGGESAE